VFDLVQHELKKRKGVKGYKTGGGAFLEGLSAVNAEVSMEARSGTPPASTGGQFGSVI
jgi:hypothetical protein